MKWIKATERTPQHEQHVFIKFLKGRGGLFAQWDASWKRFRNINFNMQGVKPEDVEWLDESGWISINDALPEIGEYVLIHSTEGATLTGRLCFNGWAANFADGEKLMGELSATHWMPLPESPKNKQS